VNSAIEAFEREFAPWALKLPAADVAARRNGQLRAHGWSVLYEFGSDSYGDYLDYYAALRDATDARVNDDWHARIYETGQVVAFPAVLEAYLYGRDPSQEELDRARGPVLESLAPATDDAPVDDAPADDAAPPVDSDIGSADTALWADLADVVDAEPVPPKVEHPHVEPPRRPSAETPAEIDGVLDAVFGDIQIERPTGDVAAIEREPAPPPAPAPIQVAPPKPPEPVVAAKPVVAVPKPVVEKPVVVEKRASVEKPVVVEKRVSVEKPAVVEKRVSVEKPVVVEKPVAEPEEPTEEPEAPEEPVAPRRSVPGYDPFVELRTLEPKSSRHAAPVGDDFRPYWQKYPARAAGVAAALAAVLLVVVMAMSHGSSKPAKRIGTADTTVANSTATPASDTAGAAADTQNVATPSDTPDTTSASTPAPTPAPAPATTPPAASSSESSIAKPVGPGSIAPIVRARPTGS
jgi:hypothetical protein